MSRTKVILLGTGTPTCSPEAFQSSAAVIVGDQPYIIDCGGGTIQRITQAAVKHDLPQLTFPRLTRLFITHLHPDHTVGLADFLIAPWVKGRTDPIEIFGPAKTNSIIDGLLNIYEPGITEHRDGLAPVIGRIDPRVTHIQPGTVYEDSRVSVDAFPVSHGGLETYGLKFTTADGTIVFSSDTKPVPEMIEQAAGCDLLVHEVFNQATLDRRSDEWKAYYAQSHTSTHQLADIARQARPKLLVTTHNLFFSPETPESTLREISATYDGPVRVGQDFDLFEIGSKQ